MPRFGDAEPDSTDLSPEDSDEGADIEPLDPGSAGADADSPQGAGTFTDVEALVARTRRTLAAFNDLQSETGRGQMALADLAYDQAGRLQAWLQAVTAAENCPVALAAAIALDAWLTLQPSARHGEIGFLRTATLLRQRRLATAHLLTLALGLRQTRWRWRPNFPAQARLAGLIAAVHETARLGHADLDRLTLARAVMPAKCAGKSKSTRLRDLIDLFTASPLVSVRMAAKTLKITPQGVTVLLENLGAARPREITGRKRYRAWGIL